MKKVIAVVMIMALVIAFAACGGNDGGTESSGEAVSTVNVSVEGVGYFAYNAGEEISAEAEYNWTNVVINVNEPENYSFDAQPEEGYKFVKWTKNGEDFSEDALITVEVTENIELVAVFEME